MKNKNVVIGICGSIAAYKVPDIVRTLKKKGANITCILTPNGSRFVTALTLQTLANSKVYEGMFDKFEFDIEHISIAKKADIVAIVPATADMMARLTVGRADELLASVVLSTKAPVLICPAMNENMWMHPATQENVEKLKKFKYHFVQPEKGELACGVQGVGRLADIDNIIKEIEKILSK